MGFMDTTQVGGGRGGHRQTTIVGRATFVYSGKKTYTFRKSAGRVMAATCMSFMGREMDYLPSYKDGYPIAGSLHLGL